MCQGGGDKSGHHLARAGIFSFNLLLGSGCALCAVSVSLVASGASLCLSLCAGFGCVLVSVVYWSHFLAFQVARRRAELD